MAKRRIIIIGAGAAGLLAAGEAARQGAKVTLLERMKRPGRKLGITGKGRCNLTNDNPVEDFISHFGKNGRFLRQAFDRFFSHDLVELLGSLGVGIYTAGVSLPLLMTLAWLREPFRTPLRT